MYTRPIHFIANYCSIPHPTKGRASLELFDYLKRLIDTYNNYRYS